MPVDLSHASRCPPLPNLVPGLEQWVGLCPSFVMSQESSCQFFKLLHPKLEKKRKINCSVQIFDVDSIPLGKKPLSSYLWSWNCRHSLMHKVTDLQVLSSQLLPLSVAFADTLRSPPHLYMCPLTHLCIFTTQKKKAVQQGLTLSVF